VFILVDEYLLKVLLLRTMDNNGVSIGICVIVALIAGAVAGLATGAILGKWFSGADVGLMAIVGTVFTIITVLACLFYKSSSSG
jgi:fatty-acid desaturase